MHREIEQQIEQFISESGADPLDLRSWSARHRALPVARDSGGCHALRPCGEIIAFDSDEPDRVDVVSDERLRNMVLSLAATLFPPLAALVPVRPPDAPDCPLCGGSGRVPDIPAEIAEQVVCLCGGLGWVPRGSACL